MVTRATLLVVVAALVSASAAHADDRVMCPQGATVTSHFVRNISKLPVRLGVILPGAPALTITQTSQLPAGAGCAATGAVQFLPDASTDQGKSFHRVMSRALQTGDGSYTVDIAPDTFNGNFAYTAQFVIAIKAAR